MEPAAGAFRYWAFISYSHQDKAWGDWLHKSLETYRVPKALVGRQSRDGRVPRRLFPIFRDREELPTSSDLGSNITDALEASRYLVVICSPKSAVSRWVNEEIKTFKALGREDRVLCIIVDGEPNASDKPGSGLLECFPEAVRHRVDSSGNVTAVRTEPIAADARPGKDGKSNARFKLLAGLLGVGFDELMQRDKRRRRTRILQAVAASFIGLCIAGAAIVESMRRAKIEEYTEQGRTQFLAGKPDVAAVYLSKAYLFGGDSPALRFLLARSLAGITGDGTTVASLGGAVHTARLSADGSMALIGTRGRDQYVTDTRTGQRIAKFEGHDGPANTAWFSPDASLVATAGDDGTVRIWRAKDGQNVHVLKGHARSANSAVFAPSGKFVVSTGADKTVRIWDAKSGEERLSLKVAAPAYHAVFSPDGARLFAATSANRIESWSTDTFKPHRSFSGYWGWPDLDIVTGGNPAGALPTARGALFADLKTGQQLEYLPNRRGGPRGDFISPDGKLAVTAESDHSASLWDIETGRRIASLRAHEAPINTLTFSSDGTRVLSGGRDKLAILWSVPDGKVVARLKGHEGMVYEGAISPSGRRVATGDSMGRVIMWDAGTGRRLATLEQHKSAVRSLTFNSAGDRVLSAGEDGDAHFVNVGPDDAIVDLEAPPPAKAILAASADGRLLAGDGRDGVVRIWDALTGKRLGFAEGTLGYSEFTLPFNARGDLLLTATGSSATTWDLVAGKASARLEGHSKPVNVATFSIDGDRIATADDDGLVKVWDGAGRALQTIETGGGRVFDAAFLARSRLLATFSADDVLRIFDVGSGKKLTSLKGHGFPHSAKAIAAAAGRVLFTSSERSIVTWDAQAGGIVSVLKTGIVDVGQASFSPRADYVVTIPDFLEQSKTATVWKVDSGEIVATLSGHAEPVNRVAYSNDGAWIATLGDDRTTRVWDARSMKLLATYPETPSRFVTFTPGDTRMLVASEGEARSISVSRMNADSEQVQRWVECRVAWQLVGGQLREWIPDHRKCAGS